MKQKNDEKWKNEQLFVDRLLKVLRSEDRTTHFIREFRTGHGLPDLLSIEFSEVVVAKRRRRLRNRNLPPFTIDCAYTMAYLSKRRWINLSRLRLNLALGNSAFSELISTLLARGLIIRKRKKIKSLPKRDIFAIKNICAIEAKLKDWRRAIIQAQRHLWFTDSCFIVIPATNGIKERRVSSACRKYCVGLITFSNDETLEPVVKIKKSKPYNTYLAWLLNESLLSEEKNG